MKPNELLDQFLHQFNNVLAPGAETLSKEVQQNLMRSERYCIALGSSSKT
ncbi:MAG: hypothetical protein ACKVHB_01920 [Pseudomonadales bacterium]